MYDMKDVMDPALWRSGSHAFQDLDGIGYCKYCMKDPNRTPHIAYILDVTRAADGDYGNPKPDTADTVRVSKAVADGLGVPGFAVGTISEPTGSLFGPRYRITTVRVRRFGTTQVHEMTWKEFVDGLADIRKRQGYRCGA